jgi:hypothetical protein
MVTEIELFESPDLTPLYFCLWGWMKSSIDKIQVDTRDKLLSPILDAASRIEKVKVDWYEQHAIFRHELQSAWRLTAGFSDLIVNCIKFIISV